jgi:hypothetical protein
MANLDFGEAFYRGEADWAVGVEHVARFRRGAELTNAEIDAALAVQRAEVEAFFRQPGEPDMGSEAYEQAQSVALLMELHFARHGIWQTPTMAVRQALGTGLTAETRDWLEQYSDMIDTQTRR